MSQTLAPKHQLLIPAFFSKNLALPAISSQNRARVLSDPMQHGKYSSSHKARWISQVPRTAARRPQPKPRPRRGELGLPLTRRCDTFVHRERRCPGADPVTGSNCVGHPSCTRNAKGPSTGELWLWGHQ